MVQARIDQGQNWAEDLLWDIVNYLWLRVIVKEGVNKSNHPIQNLLLLVTTINSSQYNLASNSKYLRLTRLSFVQMTLTHMTATHTVDKSYVYVNSKWTDPKAQYVSNKHGTYGMT
jgi:hypothetical protein